MQEILTLRAVPECVLLLCVMRSILYCLGGCKSYLHILIKEQWVIASFREQQIIISLIEETKTHKLTTRGFALILICTVTSDTNL